MHWKARFTDRARWKELGHAFLLLPLGVMNVAVVMATFGGSVALIGLPIYVTHLPGGTAKFWLFDVGEVAAVFGFLEGEVGEVVAELVREVEAQDGIVRAPVEVGGRGDWRARRGGPRRDLRAQFRNADVPIESALQVPGAQEIVDPFLEIGLEGFLLMAPVRQEVAEVDAARLAR
jgi:hypothetical protein